MSLLRTDKSFALRGSSWVFDARYACGTYRLASYWFNASDNLGFRLLRRVS